MGRREKSIFNSALPFFGLGPEHRLIIFKELHEITFHGQGGYNWDIVYNMPIWLRRYTFNELKKFYEEKNNAQNGDVVKKSIDAMKAVGAVAKNKPIEKVQVPSYVTKASKK